MAVDDAVSPELYSDSMVFAVALGVYEQSMPKDDLFEEGLVIFRRYRNNLRDGAEKYLRPLVEEEAAYASSAPRYRTMMTSTHKVGNTRYGIEAVLDIMRTRPSDIRATFQSSGAVRVVTSLSRCLDSDDPKTIMAELVRIPSVSRSRVTKSWIRKAAQEMGVVVSEVEATLVDAQDAKNLGTQLAEVEEQIQGANPMTPEGAELVQKREEVVAEIEGLARESLAPEVVVAVAASSAAAKDNDPLTRGMSADQIKAMRADGKALIAAGAGSGKTRVLAMMVVDKLRRGMLPRQMLVTSFTKKAAAEIRERVEKYGGEIPYGSDIGFGTTHKIAGGLLRSYGGVDDFTPLSGGDAHDIIRIAMEQVKMTGAPPGNPPVESFFPDISGKPITGLDFRKALELAYQRRNKVYGFLLDFIIGIFDPNNRWQSTWKGRTDPRTLTTNQQEILKKLFKATGIDYDPSTDPVLMAQDAKKGQRLAAVEEPIQTQRPVVAGGRKKDKLSGMAEKYATFKNPAKMWFNIGHPLTDEKSEGKPEPMEPGTFKRAISKYKGAAISPTEAWARDASPEAAVYGAYEWLKGPKGDPNFTGKTDFDDVLLNLIKKMVGSPGVLKKIQSNFKLVCVDEAQDLNKTQHIMFGLIAGYVDPAKVHKAGSAKKLKELARNDGKMTADTYVMIGDDKQSIYSFRGADPDQFIEMSDLYNQDADFKTYILKTNYRSGQEIVEVANRIIAHNTRQVPMTCEANPQRSSKGAVQLVDLPPVKNGNPQQAAEWVADKIEEEHSRGLLGEDSFNSYGIGVRSNAEAYAYGLELLKKGIPFRSKKNFFKNEMATAVLGWLTIIDEGLTGSSERVNEAMFKAMALPYSGLGKTFIDKTKLQAKGNYAKWLVDNWQDIYGSRGKWAERVEAFVENLLKVTSNKFENSDAALEFVMGLTGYDGSTVHETLIEKIKDDDEAMAEIRSANSEGEADEDAISSAAMAPISPIQDLMRKRANLSETMKFVRTLQNANEKLAVGEDSKKREPAVEIETIHKWKGREVRKMIVPIVGGRFPRQSDSEEEVADARRLAYVAITRGEEEVFVLNIPLSIEMPGGQAKVIQSQFIGEMCIPNRSLPMNEDEELDTFGMKLGSVEITPEMEEAYLRGEIE